MSENYVGRAPNPINVLGDYSPIGAIIFAHAVPDATWLQINGQIVSKLAYPDLWTYAQSFLTADQVANPGLYRSVDANTFALPKLDGLFIRGVGSFDAARTSAALGVRQDDIFKSHLHNTPGTGGGGSSAGLQGNTGGGPIGNADSLSVGSVETRPTNVALVPCVKAIRTVFIAPTSDTLGRLLQVAQHGRTDAASGTTILPGDDTIPQITEGTEFFNLVYTPQKVGSRARVTVHAFVAETSGGSLFLGGALFRVGQANALAAGIVIVPADDRMILLRFEYEFITADLSAINFTARFGCSIAHTTRLNSLSSGRLFGGAMTSFLRVEEFGP